MCGSREANMHQPFFKHTHGKDGAAPIEAKWRARVESQVGSGLMLE